MSVGSHILAVLKRHFLSGVLVVVPIILTYIVIKFLFTAVDSVLEPLLLKLLGYHIPGLGFITTLALIFLAGFFTRNLLGARLYRGIEVTVHQAEIGQSAGDDAGRQQVHVAVGDTRPQRRDRSFLAGQDDPVADRGF